MPELELIDLTKQYGSFCAVDQVNLAVEAGEVFGFLGPNGAGKTTTIRLLMGMLIPTSGQAKLHGLDCHHDRVQVKRHVGYLPDSPAFHDYLRGRETLLFIGKMHGLDRQLLNQRIDELLERFSLTDAALEFAVNYSTGMKRKLALAGALIHDPEIFILDEPTSGLDPGATRDLLQWIQESAKQNKTIFLSTHLLDMAEKVCHRIGIINNGQLLAAGPVDELRQKYAPTGTIEDIFFAATQQHQGESPDFDQPSDSANQPLPEDAQA